MRPITVLRAAAWFGAVIVWWSLNLRWGTDVDAGTGPTPQLHRLVVGAALLATIAALALSVSGRGKQPPAPWAKGVAVGGAALAVVLAFLVRSRALADDFGHLLAGHGWLWMLAGGGMVLGAAVGAAGLRPPVEKATGPKRKRRNRR